MISCNVSNQEMSRVTAISQAESLARLVGSTPWVMFDHTTAKAHLEIFRSLAASCHSFELHAGHDLFRDGSKLAALLDPDRLAKIERSTEAGKTSDPGWA
jgi:hypothetical protein